MWWYQQPPPTLYLVVLQASLHQWCLKHHPTPIRYTIFPPKFRQRQKFPVQIITRPFLLGLSSRDLCQCRCSINCQLLPVLLLSTKPIEYWCVYIDWRLYPNFQWLNNSISLQSIKPTFQSKVQVYPLVIVFQGVRSYKISDFRFQHTFIILAPSMFWHPQFNHSNHCKPSAHRLFGKRGDHQFSNPHYGQLSLLWVQLCNGRVSMETQLLPQIPNQNIPEHLWFLLKVNAWKSLACSGIPSWSFSTFATFAYDWRLSRMSPCLLK